MGFVTIDIYNINLDNDNFDEDDRGAFVLVRLSTWCINSVKHVKKDRQRINAYSMGSNKKVGLVCDKREKVVEW